MEYPKLLPKLCYKTIQLETGFYPTEVVALENGWRLIKPCLVNHSTKISINEYFWFLEKFRDAKTEKINLSILHQYTYNILDIYGRLIESGLNDMAFIHMLLSDMKSMHGLYGIRLDDIKLIICCINQYLLDFLVNVKSTSFENGLNKLNELIVDLHKEHAKGDQLADGQND